MFNACAGRTRFSIATSGKQDSRASLPSATGAAPIRRHSAAAAATDKFQVTATAAVVAAIADALLGYEATTGDPSSRRPTAEEGLLADPEPTANPDVQTLGLCH